MRIMLPDWPTSAEQLLQLREPGFRHELVRGELRRMSNAGWWHGAVAIRIGARLQTHADRHDLGLVFAAETGFLLERNPDTVRSPDAAFVRTARIPRAWSRGYFDGAPDLAVEVTSPNDTASAIDEKARSWLASGTLLVWVIDPETQAVRVYRPSAIEDLQPTDTLRGEHVLPGFELPIAELFPAPRGSCES